MATTEIPVPPARRLQMVSPDRRTHTKLIRLNAAELREVMERASACSRPVACYIRESALGTKPRARSGAVEEILIHQLARVGTRLRDLARVAAAAHLPQVSAFEVALEDLLDVIRHMG